MARIALLILFCPVAFAAITETPSNTFTDLYGDQFDNKVVFGNAAVAGEFQAHVKMEFWGEDYISLCEEGVKGTPTLKGETLELDLADIKIEWFKSNENLKWVRTLKKKPVSNSFSYRFGDDWKQFRYCYQTPLREMFPDDPYEYYTDSDGFECIRIIHPPEHPDGVTWRRMNVEGSYAAFHNTKRNYGVGGKNYRTGKALHIYRSKAIDTDGKFAWVELNIEKGIYSETIPQVFLDTAKYPVKINADFGYTSIAETSSGLATAYCYAFGPYTSGSNGEVTHCTIYFQDASAADVTLVFYSNTLQGEPGEPGGIQGEGQNASATANPDWLTIALDNEVGTFTITALDFYWLGFAAGETLDSYYDADTEFRKYLPEAYAGGGVAAFDDPWTPDTDTSHERRYSTYITYTPAAGMAIGALMQAIREDKTGGKQSKAGGKQ